MPRPNKTIIILTCFPSMAFVAGILFIMLAPALNSSFTAAYNWIGGAFLASLPPIAPVGYAAYRVFKKKVGYGFSWGGTPLRYTVAMCFSTCVLVWFILVFGVGRMYTHLYGAEQTISISFVIPQNKPCLRVWRSGHFPSVENICPVQEHLAALPKTGSMIFKVRQSSAGIIVEDYVMPKNSKGSE